MSEDQVRMMTCLDGSCFLCIGRFLFVLVKIVVNYELDILKALFCEAVRLIDYIVSRCYGVFYVRSLLGVVLE